jgi:hypothetical protein
MLRFKDEEENIREEVLDGWESVNSRAPWGVSVNSSRMGVWDGR